jgi:hypothetical protein
LERYQEGKRDPESTVGGKHRRTKGIVPLKLPHPCTNPWVPQALGSKPAFTAESTKVVSANAARPSGAGSATDRTCGAVVGSLLMIGPPKRRSEILALAITPDAKGPALRLAQALSFIHILKNILWNLKISLATKN